MSPGSEPTVLYREADPDRRVGVITLNRPDKLNALNPTVLVDLAAALDRFESDADARVGVVKGAGRAFLAGADIEHYLDLTLHEYREFMVRGRAVHDRLTRCRKLIVAAVHGYALGGGLEIALCCDLIVAERDAQLGLPEVRLGLLPGGGGTQRLERLVGARRALDLLVTGRMIEATEAAEWGLVNRLVEPGEAVAGATALAAQIARRPPLAVQLAKRLVREGADAALETALTLEQAETAALYRTEDAAEGIRAFVEKRHGAFHGR
jgi:enoyl-CoA hydratase/carnithine racemase